MCGIAGKVFLDPARPGDEAAVAAMTAALVHRGPDDAGLAVGGPAALGHRRLAIVDLSPRGRQPLHGTDGTTLLVVNGEIYNHRELRRELAAVGHRFTSDCDSEVILPLYRQHYEREGPAFVDRLDGMFAFALWDGAARRLLLARDRTGQKPLMYSLREGALSFASELGALGRDPDVDRTPDDGALADFLAFRCVPHPATAWRGARKLPPASVLVLEDGAATVHRTWRLPAAPDTPAPPSMDEAAERVRAALSAAVRKRLMSDVSLGALLSGGLDSAAVVALMAEAGAAPLRTFTIGFDEPAWDESARARKVARLFGTEHHEEVVRPQALDLVDLLLRHYGEPFADASALPTFLVSRLAARHVKVVLTGDGGDESFAGYDRYRALLLAQRLGRPWAAPLRAVLSVAAALGERLPSGGQRSPLTRLGRFAEAARLPPRRANDLWRRATPPGQLASLLTPEGRRRLGTSSTYGPDSDRPLSLDEALALDVARYLPDDLLVKLDVASMAHSLEARSPFLDVTLMETAATLPGVLKRRGRRGKRVLRRALADLLPPDLLEGPKQGFGVPLDEWLRGPLLPHLRAVLLSPEARRRGLLDTGAVAALIDAHAGRKVAAHESLFTLLVLERWFLEQETTT